MRKDRVYVLGSLALFLWMCMTYFLFVHSPNAERAVRRRLGLNPIAASDGNQVANAADNSIDALAKRVDAFDHKLKSKSEDASRILEEAREELDEASQILKKIRGAVKLHIESPPGLIQTTTPKVLSVISSMYW